MAANSGSSSSRGISPARFSSRSETPSRGSPRYDSSQVKSRAPSPVRPLPGQYVNDPHETETESDVDMYDDTADDNFNRSRSPSPHYRNESPPQRDNQQAREIARSRGHQFNDSMVPSSPDMSGNRLINNNVRFGNLSARERADNFGTQRSDDTLMAGLSLSESPQRSSLSEFLRPNTKQGRDARGRFLPKILSGGHPGSRPSRDPGQVGSTAPRYELRPQSNNTQVPISTYRSPGDRRYPLRSQREVPAQIGSASTDGSNQNAQSAPRSEGPTQEKGANFPARDAQGRLRFSDPAEPMDDEVKFRSSNSLAEEMDRDPGTFRTLNSRAYPMEHDARNFRSKTDVMNRDPERFSGPNRRAHPMEHDARKFRSMAEVNRDPERFSGPNSRAHPKERDARNFRSMTDVMNSDSERFSGLNSRARPTEHDTRNFRSMTEVNHDPGRLNSGPNSRAHPMEHDARKFRSMTEVNRDPERFRSSNSPADERDHDPGTFRTLKSLTEEMHRDPERSRSLNSLAQPMDHDPGTFRSLNSRTHPMEHDARKLRSLNNLAGPLDHDAVVSPDQAPTSNPDQESAAVLTSVQDLIAAIRSDRTLHIAEVRRDKSKKPRIPGDVDTYFGPRKGDIIVHQKETSSGKLVEYFDAERAMRLKNGDKLVRVKYDNFSVVDHLMITSKLYLYVQKSWIYLGKAVQTIKTA